MDLVREIALRTDPDAEACLKAIVEERKSHFDWRTLFERTDDIESLVSAVLGEVEMPVAPTDDREETKTQLARAVRGLLVDLASNPELSHEVAMQLDRRRQTQLDPLFVRRHILAGMAIALSPYVDFHYARDAMGRETVFEFKVLRRPEVASVLSNLRTTLATNLRGVKE
jgi:hypothetical protein